jgi:hypothetical protein
VRDSRPAGKLPPLRDYQQEAVEAIVKGQADGGRGQFRAACGSGKSLVAVHAAARLCPIGLVVMACPSLPLLAQTLAVWAAAGMAAQALAVCSDDTVADTAARTTDLRCPVTTRPDEIAGWVRRTPTGRMRLILVTHASIAVVGEGLHAADTTASLLVIDEAHHTAGWPGKHVALAHRIAALDAIGMRWEISSGWTGVHQVTASRNGHTSGDNESPDDSDPTDPNPVPRDPGGPTARLRPGVSPRPAGQRHQSSPSTRSEGTH